ncbi:hypothetical protein FHU41_002841 [Psychromicrobium silvestre]|uniref:Uncharacterized protein n=1 Tax=Psychromicrobium silvestre TaxID=1645614 RepID=A0A7Y9S934_9MICC|nr:hypothetical protein [Psychromicrobium silvestre]NYE96591.1 hypothetical protein [Psychromicrobium silvestre]
MSYQEPERENSLLSSILLFLLFFVLFLGGIVAFSWGTLQNVWPFAIGLGLFFLSFWVPQTFLGRSDTGRKSMVKTAKRKPSGEF